MRKRSCGSQCRNAKSPRKTCTCKCKGTNHGGRWPFGVCVVRVKRALKGIFEPAKIELTKEG